MFLTMVSRDEWRALPPLADIPLVTHPVENVIYQHSLDVPVCESDRECTKAVQDMQKKDMEEGKPDIIYNFLIGGNGKVYEGRGWYNQSDVHMYPEYNGNRIDIAYIGNFTTPQQTPAKLQYMGIKLAELGVDMMYLTNTYNGIPDKYCGMA